MNLKRFLGLDETPAPSEHTLNEQQIKYQVSMISDPKELLADLQFTCIRIASQKQRPGDLVRLNLLKQRAVELHIPETDVKDMEVTAIPIGKSIIDNVGEGITYPTRT